MIRRRRAWSHALVPALLLAVLGCRDREVSTSSALELVPAVAEEATTFDVAAAMQIAPLANVAKTLTTDGVAEASKFTACGYTLETLRRVTVAEGGDLDEKLYLIEGAGFGEQDRLECVAEAFGAALEWVELDGRRVGYMPAIPDNSVFLLDDDRLMIAGDDWSRAAAALLEHQGESVLSAGGLHEAHTLVGSEGAILWYAGELPPLARLMNFGAAAKLDEVELMAVAAHVTDEQGLRVRTGLRFATDEAANTYATETSQIVDMLRDKRKRDRVILVGGMLSKPHLSHLQLHRDGRWVVLELDFNEAQLERILAKLTERMKPFMR